ncbi:hypothetical protein JTE90_018801 [Oedothorax gibbosus]|uniref:Uncharacterized protein n=1 Tax=Oedothorax gibbosus TaxID=931172 RepID=A0AAV6TQZ5_9ARAC|nr:hypothetical protein JTE90_018801 [Oedothorax gibbosus]
MGDLMIFDELQAVADSLGEKCFVSLGAYSTVAPVSVPDKISELRLMVAQHPRVIEHINEGRGRPLKIFLTDIHSVQSNFTEFKINEEVMAVLKDIEVMYDDVRNANYIFKEWDEDRPYLSPEQERKVKSFLRHFRPAHWAIRYAISLMDVTGSPSQFDDAKKTYNYDGEEKLYRYTVEVRDLIKSLDENSLPLLDVQEETRGY